jgi:hypothetical protein
MYAAGRNFSGVGSGSGPCGAAPATAASSNERGASPKCDSPAVLAAGGWIWPAGPERTIAFRFSGVSCWASAPNPTAASIAASTSSVFDGARKNTIHSGGGHNGSGRRPPLRPARPQRTHRIPGRPAPRLPVAVLNRARQQADGGPKTKMVPSDPLLSSFASRHARPEHGSRQPTRVAFVAPRNGF